MDLHALLGELQATGHTLQLVDGKLVCRGPERVSARLASAIQAQREELLRHFAALAPEAALDDFCRRMADVFGLPMTSELRRGGAPNSARAAADLLARSVPFTTAASTTECYCCGGTRQWRLHDGCPWICARCHPSCRPAAELEWRDGAHINRSRPVAAPRPVSPGLAASEVIP